ncbi:MAG: hypothetical protein Q4G43_10815 [Mobilicoccus sp.]|nr:hypothetical protein [Mobilicoccus sp.]
MARVWDVTAVVYLAVLGWAALALPARRVALYVTPAGDIITTATRTEFLLVNALIAAVALIVLPMAVRASTRPPLTWDSLPHREHWLAPEREATTRAHIGGALWALLAGTNLLLAATVADLILITLSGRALFGTWPVFVYLAGAAGGAALLWRHYSRPG